MLPLVAHAESYRAHSAGKRTTQRAGLDMMWTEDQVGLDLDRILERWFRRQRAATRAGEGGPELPGARADLRRPARRRAAGVPGDRTARYAAPWAYTGDPESSFSYWRQRLLGS